MPSRFGSNMMWPGFGGGGANPLASYAVALDFKNRQYWVGGTNYASLAAIPGYAASTAPTLDATGLVVPDNRTLSFTINPVTTDQDFILWAVVNHASATTGAEIYTALGPAAPNGALLIYRSGSGNMTGSFNGVVGFSNTSNVLTTGRGVDLYRRRAGKNTISDKVGSTVTVGTEDAGTTFGPVSNLMTIGNIAGGGLPANATIEGVYLRQGSFTDLDLNTILAAA